MEEIAIVLFVVTLLLHTISLYVKAKRPVGFFALIVSVATLGIWMDGATAPYAFADIGVICILVYCALMSVVMLVSNPDN